MKKVRKSGSPESRKVRKKLQVLILACCLMFLSSCGLFKKQDPFAKAELQAQEFYLQYPGELAKVCAQKYPVDISRVDTGKWVIVSDTSRYIAGTVRAQNFVPLTDFWKTPDESDTVICKTDTIRYTRTITNTKYRTDTLKIKDVAAIDSLKNYITRQNDMVSKSIQQHIDDQVTIKQQNKILLYRLFGIIGLSLFSVILLYLLIQKIL